MDSNVLNNYFELIMEIKKQTPMFTGQPQQVQFSTLPTVWRITNQGWK